jgi:hypothetical protein
MKPYIITVAFQLYPGCAATFIPLIRGAEAETVS